MIVIVPCNWFKLVIRDSLRIFLLRCAYVALSEGQEPRGIGATKHNPARQTSTLKPRPIISVFFWYQDLSPFLIQDTGPQCRGLHTVWSQIPLMPAAELNP